MATETVRVLAKITAQPDKIEALKSVLADLVAPSRAERGCISYGAYQDSGDPAEFVTVEEWEDDAAVDAHMTTAHVQAAFAKAGALLAKPPDIRRYSKIA